MNSVLVANRGEVALRVVRAARRLGMRVVTVHTQDEASSPVVGAADDAVELSRTGAAAYLDGPGIIRAALDHGCDMVHPGYGFLSEDAVFAEACAVAGLTFVGPSVDTLQTFGDKVSARGAAAAAGLAVLPARDHIDSWTDAQAFMDSLGGAPIAIKARSGGGGRGIRMVEDPSQVREAFERCRSEATRVTGSGDVYVERCLAGARHVEVQVAGDGHEVAVLGDRDCSLQSRQQKIIEIGPAPGLEEQVRRTMWDQARAIAEHVGYRGVGTVEFLVDRGSGEAWFLEVNPRLQVEHGVTEETSHCDLVAAQLLLAQGLRLAESGLPSTPEIDGIAIEARVNLTSGGGRPITGLVLPSGPDLRVETHLREGMIVSESFDPLLAKVIVTRADGDLARAAERLTEVLGAVRIEGPRTNLATLGSLLSSGALHPDRLHTGLVEELAGRPAHDGAHGVVAASMSGTVIDVRARPGERVGPGATLVVIEAMKLEHAVTAPRESLVVDVMVAPGSTVAEGDELVSLSPAEDGVSSEVSTTDEPVPESLRILEQRRSLVADESRPDAVRRRHAAGRRTARENVHALLGGGAFHEYGALAVAAQRRRRPLEELEQETPADGIVTGLGTLETAEVDPFEVAVIAHDYTVLAGTQGIQGHRKTERMLEVAVRRGSPVVVFAEGGGGRPGDTDNQARATGMDLGTFTAMARTNGRVPSVGIAAGRCFAGNAVLLGLCDLVIATDDANIGLGGPAMIEGGGMGRFSADEIGPAREQHANGVVDVLVEDEAQATEAARRFLGLLGGRSRNWEVADQDALRTVIPDQRRRSYDVRALVEVLCDRDSVLELRAGFGRSAFTALARIEGRPVGILANDVLHLGGAIDADAADKFARFLQLCDTHGLPVLSLCDTPGFMVGPESEQQAAVRHVTRMLVAAPNLWVPFMCVVTRRSYGLGGQAMAGGSYRVPDAIVAWPTGDIGAMGPEGAARLGYRKELESVPEGSQRDAEVRRLADEYQDQGRAINAASVFEIDDVIDPAQTRAWVIGVLGGASHRTDRRRLLDTW
jgi:acetyl/propionyl-CoA carboxylase alpha subunit/acetyl-CoA carboxylase carboxyltransferase component